MLACNKTFPYNRSKGPKHGQCAFATLLPAAIPDALNLYGTNVTVGQWTAVLQVSPLLHACAFQKGQLHHTAHSKVLCCPVAGFGQRRLVCHFPTLTKNAQLICLICLRHNY